MTTQQELIDRIQGKLNDATAASWAEALLAEWIETGIKEYSLLFPRRITVTITDTVDVRKYDLPADYLSVLTVEFPKGEDPPLYLTRRAYDDPRGFWDLVGYFDILPRSDATNLSEIWISEKPTGSQEIEVEYLGQHDYDLAVGDTLTIPIHHETIIEAYTFWQAWQNLTSAEMINPTSNSSLLMAQMEQNTTRAERRYNAAIKRALENIHNQNPPITWQPPGHERIY